MKTTELLDSLKAKALEQFTQDQEEFVRGNGRGIRRSEQINARMAEVHAATTIGDVLHVMVKRYEADAFTYDDDAPSFRKLPQSVEHEKVYLFILRVLGVEDLTLKDVHQHPLP